MTVGEQHRRRAQPVLPQEVLQPVSLDADPGVDDKALLAGCRSEDVAVRGERCGRKRKGEHAAETTEIA
jgi:hypothetical protein